MTQARKTQIDPATTPYYHCVNRCVRRAYLCGEDEITGKSYEHRKQWVVDKLKQLAGVFAIDICAYAVMSNHYHVVLHINMAEAESWSEKEVANRWRELFKGNLLVDRWLQSESLSEAEYLAVSEVVGEWRKRLMDISWFMRCLNEGIARLANEEDNCKGRFWENRFKSQALLDEAAILSCMMYVDLNPVRAAMADNLSDSDFTSIQQRLREFAERKPGRPRKTPEQTVIKGEPPELMSFAKVQHTDEADPELSENNIDAPAALPFAFDDYCELIDWTGRAIRNDKRGHIPKHIQPLLQQLGIQPEHWLDVVKHFESRFPVMAGRIDRLKQAAERFEHRWFKGVSTARRCYCAT